jgi:glycosyltransferase involved in cell wall biosynthesis
MIHTPGVLTAPSARPAGGTAAPAGVAQSCAPEVSVVIPCLNEADTVGACVEKALGALRDSELAGEVIVADNGSTDGSPAIAERLGARVVPVEARGYGHALMDGIEAARAPLIVMGDADDSYDFRQVPAFVAKLRQGFDLVQGCRLPQGGGTILPGAMPPLHRKLGNPILSWIARRWFGAPVHDVYCGLRGFTREHYRRLQQRCTGMEFAVEMIVRSTLCGGRMAEIPITFHPDGRRTHPPHLRTMRDGWRTLRLFLLYTPGWLFLLPGGLLLLLGATVRGVTFDAHTLLFASLAILCGYQALQFAAFSKAFAVGAGLLPETPWLTALFGRVGLERGLLVGVLALLGGAALLLGAVEQWRAAHFGQLDYAQTMRWVIPGATLTALGLQTMLGSFLLSILGMGRR